MSIQNRVVDRYLSRQAGQLNPYVDASFIKRTDAFADELEKIKLGMRKLSAEARKHADDLEDVLVDATKERDRVEVSGTDAEFAAAEAKLHAINNAVSFYRDLQEESDERRDKSAAKYVEMALDGMSSWQYSQFAKP
jgi:hypothetical protein